MTPKTKWGKRNVPLQRAVRTALQEWMESGWKTWVGRQPTQNDFLFPNADGKAYRVLHGDQFRSDLAAAGCPTDFGGKPLTQYALRHLFSTMLMEAHASDAAHDRLLGHRPRDTKTMNYSAKLVSFLALEIERIPFDLSA